MTPRQWGLLGLLVVVAGVLLAAARWQDREAAAWKARAQTAEAEVARVVQLADQARRDARRWQRVADSLFRHRDTLILTRWRTVTDTAWLGADTTLASCRAALTGFRTLCRVALDSVGGELGRARAEADAARTGLAAMTRSDSLRAVALDSLRTVLKAAPTARPWWRPRIVAGVGCAGGAGFGCGLMAGVGLTF